MVVVFAVALCALVVPLAAASPAHADGLSHLTADDPTAVTPTATDDPGDTDSRETTAPGDATARPSPPPPTSAFSLRVNSPGPLVSTSAVTVTGSIAGDVSRVASIMLSTKDEPPTTAALTTDKSGFSGSIDVIAGADVTITATALDADGDPIGEPATTTFDVLFAPAVTHNGPIVTGGTIRGFGYPGSKVRVRAGSLSCEAVVNTSREWQCFLDGSGENLALTATQTITFDNGNTWTSSASAAVPVTIDKTGPKPPRITSPAAGSSLALSGARVSGTAETGAMVKVFSGARTLCETVAAAGAWSCALAGFDRFGSRALVAVAWDEFGNSSGNGASVTYQFGTSSPTSTEPAAPKMRSPHPPSESPQPAPDTSTPEGDESESAPPTAAAPPPPGHGGGSGGWARATPFTDALPPVIGIDAVTGWLRALLLAVITVLLVLIPARLLAGTIARRRASAATVVALTGRNRAKAEFDIGFALGVPGRTAMLVVGMLAAGALTIFANPVDGEPEYLRLLIAACLAVGLVNAVSSWVPRILVHAWQCGFAEIRFNPRWLLVVGSAVLVSRLFDLHPALLFALVTTVRVPSVLSDAVRARLALSRIGGVFVAGVVAWLLAAAVPSGGGFIAKLLVETATITALVGIGSAAIMMVPLGRLSGRAIFAWSRPLWTASVLAILTALFVMLGPAISDWRATGNVLAALAVTLCFAALAVSVWLWKRYVQPRLTA